MCARTSTTHIYFQNYLGTFLNLVTIAYVTRRQLYGVENAVSNKLPGASCTDTDRRYNVRVDNIHFL